MTVVWSRTFLRASLVLMTLLLLFAAAQMPVFDQPLRQELQKLERTKTVRPPPENAFISLLALRSGFDKNIFHVGAALSSRLESNRKKGLNGLSNDDFLELMGAPIHPSDWSQSFTGCAPRRAADCVPELLEQLAGVDPHTQALGLMMDRYRVITGSPVYESELAFLPRSPVQSSTRWPFDTLLRLSQLVSIMVYRDRPEDFLAHAGADIEFWRRMLANGETMIEKMVALAAVWHNVKLLHEFIGHKGDLNPLESAQVERSLAPLTREQSDISSAFLSETRLMNHWIDDASRGFPKGVLRWLEQPTATKNLFYAVFTEPLIRLAPLPAGEFARLIRHGQLPSRPPALEALDALSLGSLYNPGGRLLVSQHWCRDCYDYIARVHDLNSMIGIVRLHRHMSLAAWADSSDRLPTKTWNDPDLGHEITIDHAARLMHFDCLSLGSVCQLKL